MKRTNFPKTKKLTLSIPSFEKGLSLKYDKNLSNIEFASEIENFSFNTGALTNGIGFENIFNKIAKQSEIQILTNDLQNVGGIEKLIYFYKFNSTSQTREDKLIFISNIHEVYYVNLYSTEKQLTKLRNVKFSSTPIALRYRLNGEDVIIFTSETDNMTVWDGTNNPYEVLDAPHISSMTVHFERLFATVDGEKNSIWFSDELDPTEWSISLDEAGFIEMVDERGALIKVVSFLDYVYIFREYGISRLSAFGNQSSFSCSNLYVSSGRINPESVCVCGDKILFLASDGIYKFDGVDTVKILTNIEDGFASIDNKNAVACFSGSSYFLACNFKTESENLNTLLEIDTNSYSLKNIVKGYDFKFISSISTSDYEGVVAIVKESTKNAFLPAFILKNGEYFGIPTKKVWKSQTTNIGDSFAKKVLRNIYVQTLSPIKIIVEADGNEHEFCFSENKNICMKTCMIPVSDFAFKIICDNSACNIKNLKFDFYKLWRNTLWTMVKVHI